MQTEQITLDNDEQKRAMVLNHVVAGEWTNQQAAVALEISQRQLRRLKKAYRREGAAGLVNGNRGRRPSHAVSDEIPPAWCSWPWASTWDSIIST